MDDLLYAMGVTFCILALLVGTIFGTTTDMRSTTYKYRRGVEREC